MEIKDILKNRKIKVVETKRKVLPWQDYAARIIEEFKIVDIPEIKNSEGEVIVKKQNFKSRIFQMAKNKMPFLQAKVGNMREMMDYNMNLKKDLERTNKTGNYFISTFRK